MSLPYQLDRVITIAAPRETVFSFFTDNARWAAWWGPGSTIEPRRRRPSPHRPSEQSRGEWRSRCREPARLDHVHIRLWRRRADSARGIAGHDPPGTAWRRHAAASDAHVQRHRAARPSRPGLALPVVAVQQCGAECRARGRGHVRGRLVRTVVGARRRRAFTDARAHRVGIRAFSRSFQRPRRARRRGRACHRRATLHAGPLAAAARARSSLPGCRAGGLGSRRRPTAADAAQERMYFTSAPTAGSCRRRGSGPCRKFSVLDRCASRRRIDVRIRTHG